MVVSRRIWQLIRTHLIVKENRTRKNAWNGKILNWENGTFLQEDTQIREKVRKRYRNGKLERNLVPLTPSSSRRYTTHPN